METIELANLNEFIGWEVFYMSRFLPVKSIEMQNNYIYFNGGRNPLIIHKDKIAKERKHITKIKQLNHMENETKIVVATKQLDSLESILMNSIEKINENAEFVKQAEMINKTAKNLIDLNKLKLKAIVELGKNR